MAAGRAWPSSTSSRRRNSAVGALPMTATAPVSSGSQRSTATAERVVPAAAGVVGDARLLEGAADGVGRRQAGPGDAVGHHHRVAVHRPAARRGRGGRRPRRRARPPPGRAGRSCRRRGSCARRPVRGRPARGPGRPRRGWWRTTAGRWRRRRARRRAGSRPELPEAAVVAGDEEARAGRRPAALLAARQVDGPARDGAGAASTGRHQRPGGGVGVGPGGGAAVVAHARRHVVPRVGRIGRAPGLRGARRARRRARRGGRRPGRRRRPGSAAGRGRGGRRRPGAAAGQDRGGPARAHRPR